MKKLFVIIIALFAAVNTFAQTLPPLYRYDLKTEESCEAADEIALNVADYLFAMPLITDDENRLRAASFLNRWMEGTPTYHFVIDEDITMNFEGDPDLTDMYMAALTRYQLQNPDVEDEDKISYEALRQVLEYANKDENMVLLNKRLEKLIVANQKGQLEKVL
ncbi:MAG: hypothetical protein EOP46_10180 [Sphingobacteriaceae bacterium]|nr:MAG: hypothetical protein EOP46_10180 [Sphingobacteriaceae bacterium]